MAKGKQTCKILKEIRKQIAEDNDIELVISECTYQGDCLGTCPKCEAEVRYLERELEKRQRMGKAAVFAGMSLGTLFAATGCSHIIQPLAGMPADALGGTEVVKTDTVCKKPLAGDVVATEPIQQMAPPDTIIEEPLMGIVPMYRAMFPFDVEQYQNTMKELFVFPGMKNLSVVGGEILYEHVGVNEAVCETLEQLIAATKEFRSPCYSDGELKMLEQIAFELKNKDIDDEKFSGDMEMAFLVDASGKLHEVEVIKGIDKVLDAAMVDVFEQMTWRPAMYELKDGSMTSPFECRCVLKIHFPIDIEPIPLEGEPAIPIEE